MNWMMGLLLVVALTAGCKSTSKSKDQSDVASASENPAKASPDERSFLILLPDLKTVLAKDFERTGMMPSQDVDAMSIKIESPEAATCPVIELIQGYSRETTIPFPFLCKRYFLTIKIGRFAILKDGKPQPRRLEKVWFERLKVEFTQGDLFAWFTEKRDKVRKFAPALDLTDDGRKAGFRTMRIRDDQSGLSHEIADLRPALPGDFGVYGEKAPLLVSSLFQKERAVFVLFKKACEACTILMDGLRQVGTYPRCDVIPLTQRQAQTYEGQNYYGYPSEFHDEHWNLLGPLARYAKRYEGAPTVIILSRTEEPGQWKTVAVSNYERANFLKIIPDYCQ